MKIVYFPFTAIDPRQAERLAAVWGPVTLLQPSMDTVLPETRRLQDAGIIDLLFPPEESREDGLQEAMEAFEQWALQHAGSDRGALLELARAFPFFDSRFPAQLATDIRRDGRSPEAAALRPALFDAQLVLAMAQKFDCQQAELARDIDALTAAEQKMLALLKGEERPGEGVAEASEAALPSEATAMLALRLKAWARIMAAAPDRITKGGSPGNAPLFLTDAPDLPAHLNELFPKMVFRLRSRDLTETHPIEDPPLPAWLVRAGGAVRFRDAGCDLIEIPDVAPPVFLERLAGRRASSDPPASAGPLAAATWIGCHPRPHDPVGGGRGAILVHS